MGSIDAVILILRSKREPELRPLGIHDVRNWQDPRRAASKSIGIVAGAEVKSRRVDGNGVPALKGGRWGERPAALKADRSHGRSDRRSSVVGLNIPLSDELIRTLAEHVADVLPARPEPESWIGVAEAAEHLACPRSRIHALVSKRAIPHHKDGRRLLFRRSDLDRFVEEGGATR